MTAYPKHWLDTVLWPLLRLFWEPFSKKRSHWWHWMPRDGAGTFQQKIIGNPQAKPGRVSFWANFWQRNFGWQEVAILEPVRCQAYRIGFISREVNKDGKKIYRQELCSVVLTGPCAVLIGPDEISFYAVGGRSEGPVELKEAIIASKAKLPRGITLI